VGEIGSELISSKSSSQYKDETYSVDQSEVSRPHTVKIEMKSPGREQIIDQLSE
jgi:hypothetical protein